MNNPALREEPRHRPAAVIPLPQEASILAWLKSSGRLMPRDDRDEHQYLDEEPEELNDLMGVDEGGYEIDDDDDSDIDMMDEAL